MTEASGEKQPMIPPFPGLVESQARTIATGDRDRALADQWAKILLKNVRDGSRPSRAEREIVAGWLAGLNKPLPTYDL